MSRFILLDRNKIQDNISKFTHIHIQTHADSAYKHTDTHTHKLTYTHTHTHTLAHTDTHSFLQTHTHTKRIAKRDLLFTNY